MQILYFSMSLWSFASRSLLWGIWLERNRRIFEDKITLSMFFWDYVQLYASWWCHCFNDLFVIILLDCKPLFVSRAFIWG